MNSFAPSIAACSASADRGRLQGEVAPGVGEFRALRRAGFAQRILAPRHVALIEKRQIDQPFAGIIDNIHVQAVEPQRAADDVAGPECERKTQFGDAPRTVGPLGGIASQRPQVGFIVEARHRVVRLRLEDTIAQAPLGFGRKERQPAADHQIAHQSGDEHGFAGPRQSRHAEADGGREGIFEGGAGGSQGRSARQLVGGAVQGNVSGSLT